MNRIANPVLQNRNFREFSLQDIDSNQDGKISRSEIRETERELRAELRDGKRGTRAWESEFRKHLRKSRHADFSPIGSLTPWNEEIAKDIDRNRDGKVIRRELRDYKKALRQELRDIQQDASKNYLDPEAELYYPLLGIVGAEIAYGYAQLEGIKIALSELKNLRRQLGHRDLAPYLSDSALDLSSSYFLSKTSF